MQLAEFSEAFSLWHARSGAVHEVSSAQGRYVQMSETDSTSMSAAEAIRRKEDGCTDRERWRRQREQGIEPEIDPEVGEFDWSNVRVVMPPRKIPLSVRLDEDVLTFFRAHGQGYKTWINGVLHTYMEAKTPQSRMHRTQRLAPSRIEQINAFLQARLRENSRRAVSVVEAATCLDSAGLLRGRVARRGQPLLRLLRAGLIVGQERRSNGRWWVQQAASQDETRKADIPSSTEL